MEIKILRGDGPSFVGRDSDAPAHGLDILPSKLIENAEAVMRCGVDGIESAMGAIARGVISRSEVVLRKQPGALFHGRKFVGNATSSRPGANGVRAVVPTLYDRLNGIVEVGRASSLEAEP